MTGDNNAVTMPECARRPRWHVACTGLSKQPPPFFLWSLWPSRAQRPQVVMKQVILCFSYDINSRSHFTRSLVKWQISWWLLGQIWIHCSCSFRNRNRNRDYRHFAEQTS